MAGMTMSSWSNLYVERAIRAVFLQGLKDAPTVYDKIYNVVKPDAWTEKDLTGTDFPMYSKGYESENIPLLEMAQKYLTSYTQQKFFGGFSITEEMEMFDLYKVIPKFTNKLKNVAVATIEYWGMDRFNNCTSTSTGYTLADGVALVSATHPLRYGGTFSNMPTAHCDIDVTPIENAVYHYVMLPNDRNYPGLFKNAKTILHHPSDSAKVYKLTKSRNVPFEQSSTVSAIPDYNLQALASRWLTDVDAWFVLPDNIEYNMCFKAKDPDIKVGFDDRNRDRLVTSTMYFIFGFSDPRDVYGSTGG